MIPLLDTHQHLMYPKHFSYEWAAGISVLAEADFSLPEYQQLVSAENVAGTLFMETNVGESQYQTETQFALDLAVDSNNRLIGVIAAAYPERADEFREWLERSSQNAAVVGYRRVLHVVDDSVSQCEIFRRNIRKIGDVGKCFDMCFLGKQLDVAIELATACDNTQLILDHCGVPNVAGNDISTWRQKISHLARMPHVACKISGLVAYCGENQDYTQAVRPYIEHCVETFGWDRIVWGGDWPVVKMSMDLPDWIAITRDIFSQESEQNQAKFFYANAARIYDVKLDCDCCIN